MSNEAAPRKNIVAVLVANWKLVVLGLVALIAVAIGVAEFFGSQPGFFQGYSDYKGSYETLANSAHKGMSCAECHVDPSQRASYDWALVGDFYVGLYQRLTNNAPTQPMFAKFGAPSRAVCLECHTEDWSTDSAKTSKVPHPAHLRVAAETRDCSNCHRWIGHEETYMQQHKQMPFSVVCASFPCHSGTKQADECKNCHHQLQPSLAVWREVHPQTVAAYGPNACVEKCHTADQCRTCHTTGKTPVLPGVITASTVSAIEQAHVKNDWLTQHGSFALQDQSKCMTCHVTTQECQDCHSHMPPFHWTDRNAWIGTGHPKFVFGNPKRCFECHKATQCNDCHKQFNGTLPSYPPNASAMGTPTPSAPATATQSQNATP